MAITLLNISDQNRPAISTGLSSDSKAGAISEAGALFFETDTGNVFRYDGSNWRQITVAGAQLSAEFYEEVQKGNIAGHSMVHKFGKNEAVGTTWEHVSQLPFSIANFRQSAIAMRVKAGGSANDDTAGTHAREVTIQGIDSNFAELSEAVDTAGASASSATTATFWRVHRAWVSAVGGYTNANDDTIVIEDSGGGADFIQITDDEGQTQYAGWTVPAGKTAYLIGVDVTVDASTTKTVDIRCFTREDIDTVAAPMKSKRLKLNWNGLSEPFSYKPEGPELSIPEKSDIWFEAQGSTGTSSVTIDFELLVVDD